MPIELLGAFVLFAFVTSITPGPNNMMLLASGVNFGVRRTLPHMLGISIGFLLLVVAVGTGLHQLFERFPASYQALRYAGGAYLLYLAWKIARSGAPQATGEHNARPMSFLQAAAFQWVNPKAWVMAVGAIATYLPPDAFISNVILLATLFAVVNLPSVGVWTILGSLLRRWLENPMRLRLFNLGMAALLVASLYPLLTSA
ncbi:LysE family translocator [Pseudomonas sp. NY15181]|uniref:LysE family translocator n=1 Tax=Pseudomonas sp. NY15181 TaxID=3400349 RepID=UPI003A85B9CC